jgi:hypothetical protein
VYLFTLALALRKVVFTTVTSNIFDHKYISLESASGLFGKKYVRFFPCLSSLKKKTN